MRRGRKGVTAGRRNIIDYLIGKIAFIIRRIVGSGGEVIRFPISEVGNGEGRFVPCVYKVFVMAASNSDVYLITYKLRLGVRVPLQSNLGGVDGERNRKKQYSNQAT